MTVSNWRDELAQEISDVAKLSDPALAGEISILIETPVGSLPSHAESVWKSFQNTINREAFCGAAPKTLRFVSAAPSPVPGEIALTFAYRLRGYQDGGKGRSLRIYSEADFDRLP